MDGLMKIDSVQQYNDYFGVETPHPLVTVIDGREGKPMHFCRWFKSMEGCTPKEYVRLLRE